MYVHMPASLIILANRLEYMSVSKGNAYVKAHGKIHDNQYITEEMPLHGIIYVRQFMYCVSIGVLKVCVSQCIGICWHMFHHCFGSYDHAIT